MESRALREARSANAQRIRQERQDRRNQRNSNRRRSSTRHRVPDNSKYNVTVRPYFRRKPL